MDFNLSKDKKIAILFIILTALVFSVFGFFTGLRAPSVVTEREVVREVVKEYVPQTTQEEAVIKAVKEVSPAVVSIVITKDLPIFEQYYVSPFGDDPFFKGFQVPQYRQKGTEKREVGGGTGFIVSEDGMILTNKHVVLDAAADYTVFTNDGRKFSAKVLAKDPFQDFAVLKIEKEKIVDETGSLKSKPFSVAKIGDSELLQIGQSVIAIGNALGEFRNTISVGVISGLGRTITAAGGSSFVETIEDVIQTDAAINQGNSGGPLLNLRGEVIGINTATVLGAQNIGFAIPANKAKRAIEQVKKSGKITYPFLGVYYTIVTDELKEKVDLPVNYGAWVGREKDGGKTDSAVVPDSPAQKAGITQDDIILELNGEKITSDNSLAKIIQKYNSGDVATLKILRNKEEKIISLILGERSE
ncbi:MAG: trypsin-like peptidase domain-containing protein [Candidatus Nealsonbacteria bacterium]|nr:trypsin-like peptidase domain-containing protein [Candidatus Nealsonbacteria bacterium]